MTEKFILASSSPRRRELLRQIGLDFDVVPSGVEEDFIDGESPRDHVQRLAEVKAHRVGEMYPRRWVIGADTVVSIDGHILGKPQTDRESYEMLTLLSGREHLVDMKVTDRSSQEVLSTILPRGTTPRGWAR